MSSDLYEVLSLAARYLFTLLGVLIVLRAFAWLLSDRAEKRRRVRLLPDAGMVGELIVLNGGPDLPNGTTIPVPWEGILGSVRSCDLCVPCPGIRKRHLSFSFHAGQGLLLHPFSGCDARINDVLITCKSQESETAMTHGSFLQIGSALLRLQLFAGLDPAADIGESIVFPVPQSENGSASVTPIQSSSVRDDAPAYGSVSEAEPGFAAGIAVPYGTAEPGLPATPSENVPMPEDAVPSFHGNLSKRWEADWSD